MSYLLIFLVFVLCFLCFVLLLFIQGETGTANRFVEIIENAESDYQVSFRNPELGKSSYIGNILHVLRLKTKYGCSRK